MTSSQLLPPINEPQTNNQMAMVLAAQLQAEIQAACLMAERSPRDWDVVREQLLRECKRTSFAETARYSVPRGGGKVEGWSIRFAEAAIQTAKHLHVSVRTIWEDEDQRKVLVKVWDAQQMSSYADEVTLEKTLERKKIQQGQEVIRTRKNKDGDLLYIVRSTEDELLSKQNAVRSKSIRSNGLRLIPASILEQCLDEVKATLKKNDEQNPDAAKQKLFDAFNELGVQVADLKKVLGHDARALNPQELEMLRGLYMAIKERETTMHEFLEKIARAQEEEKDPGAGGAKVTTIAGSGNKVASVKEKIMQRAAAKANPTESSTGTAGETEKSDPSTSTPKQ